MNRPNVTKSPDKAILIKSVSEKKPTIKAMKPAEVVKVSSKKESNEEILRNELTAVLAKMQKRAFQLAQKDWLFVEMGKQANEIQLALEKFD